MTYRESYMQCETLEELEKEVRHDIWIARYVVVSPARIKVIKQVAEEVANEKFGGKE